MFNQWRTSTGSSTNPTFKVLKVYTNSWVVVNEIPKDLGLYLYWTFPYPYFGLSVRQASFPLWFVADIASLGFKIWCQRMRFAYVDFRSLLKSIFIQRKIRWHIDLKKISKQFHVIFAGEVTSVGKGRKRTEWHWWKLTHLLESKLAILALQFIVMHLSSVRLFKVLL